MEAGKFDALFSDIDGTLIFSAKRCREGDTVIEYKNGEPISCITEVQAELFSKLQNVIPVTTRSIEQYKRIEFAKFGFRPRYALCDNGGTLLVNGEPDKTWSEWSAGIYDECADELRRFKELLERDKRRSFEIRLVDGLFLFTKSSAPDETLKALGCGGLCESFSTGEKVYVVPKALNKGSAMRKLARRLNVSDYAAAGDSLMDLSMLNAADTAVFPSDLDGSVTAQSKFMFGRERFPERLTQWAAKA